MRNLMNFDRATQMSENFFPMSSFCPKYTKVWATKILRSYLSWHWTVKQNLNKPWPFGFKNEHEVNSKERCKVWKNLLWWVSKAYNVSTRKFHRNCIMTQICDDKFKGKLTRGLKNDIRNLVSFHAHSQMSWKFALWRAPFVQSI